MSRHRLRAATGAALVALVGATAPAAAATTPPRPSSPSAAASSTAVRSSAASVPPSPQGFSSQVMRLARVDRSAWPTVGLVLTVPGVADARRLTQALTLRGDQVRAEAASATALAAGDLEVVIVPRTSLTGTAMTVQRRELATLAHQLPAGARVAVLDEATGSDGLPRTPRLAADSTPAVAELATLATRPGTRSPAELVDAAMNAFTGGARVRRTVLLVTDSGQAEDPATMARVQARLAASGTQLFVLELGAPTSVATLVPATGGFTVGGAVPAQVLPSGTREVLSDLTHQYFVQFSVPATTSPSTPLTVDFRTTTARGSIDVPQAAATAPQAAPPTTLRTIEQAPAADLPLTVLAVLLVASSLLYGLGMLIASRRSPRTDRRTTPGTPGTPGDGPGADAAGDLSVVFVIPCLNEAKVIAGGVARLLDLERTDIRVLVIDDGSDDDTAAVVEGFDDPRVMLHRRHLPNARQGKGEALNAAYRIVLDRARLLGTDPGNVIVAVVDADGRLDRHVLADVAPRFRDPRMAGVQIGVRINNRHTSLLARMQDMEFVLYTEVFQKGRRHLGSTGLGGNGQFMRLSALQDLGESPWSRSLTEDLDLGVRLISRGWHTDFCPTADVHQQGVVTWRTLLRQRTRWFQGHLQAWPLIPDVLAGAPRRAKADLAYHLSSPVLLLIASLLSGSFLASLAGSLAGAATGRDPFSWWFLSTYLLTVGPALVLTTLYRRKETPALGRLQAAGLAHAYVGYSLMWYVAGWRAMGRVVLRRSGWAKTARLTEPVPVTDPPMPVTAVPIPAITIPAPVEALPVLAGGRRLIDLTEPGHDVPTMIINVRSLRQQQPTTVG